MRVLRRGTPPEEVVHYCTCTTCKSIFQFLREEGRYVSEQRDGDYIVIICPVCKSSNNVDPQRSQTNPLTSAASDYAAY